MLNLRNNPSHYEYIERGLHFEEIQGNQTKSFGSMKIIENDLGCQVKTMETRPVICEKKEDYSNECEA